MTQDMREFLRPVVEASGDLLLGPRDGEYLIVDQTGRWALTCREVLTDEKHGYRVLDQMNTLAAGAADGAEQRQTWAVHARCEQVYASKQCREVIEYLIGTLVTEGRVELRFTFVKPPDSWLPFSKWLHGQIERQPRLASSISLWGPFATCTEDEKEVLAALGCRLGYTIGGPELANGLDRVASNALREYARFGFRILIVCYAHGDNLVSIPGWIDRGLSDNEHSGFAIPLVSRHPDWIADGKYPLPEPDNYLAVINECYDRFPFYDEVFDPVSECARLAGKGGWNLDQMIPSLIHLAVQPDDGVAIFRQMWSEALHWKSATDLLTLEPMRLITDLSEVHNAKFDPASYDHECRGCELRYICGGADRVSCHYRKAFISSFLWERGRITALQR